MGESLSTMIACSTSHRESRESNAIFILLNPEQFNGLLALACNLENPDHHKACAALEIVLERNPGIAAEKLDPFFQSLTNYKHESAIRSVSKVCALLMKHHVNDKPDLLGPAEVRQIVEQCFNWLIADQKVAVKSYSIRTLFEAGKISPEVYPELVPLLEHGYPDHSAAYKAAARDVLRKVRRLHPDL